MCYFYTEQVVQKFAHKYFCTSNESGELQNSCLKIITCYTLHFQYRTLSRSNEWVTTFFFHLSGRYVIALGQIATIFPHLFCHLPSSVIPPSKWVPGFWCTQSWYLPKITVLAKKREHLGGWPCPPEEIQCSHWSGRVKGTWPGLTVGLDQVSGSEEFGWGAQARRHCCGIFCMDRPPHRRDLCGWAHLGWKAPNLGGCTIGQGLYSLVRRAIYPGWGAPWVGTRPCFWDRGASVWNPWYFDQASGCEGSWLSFTWLNIVWVGVVCAINCFYRGSLCTVSVDVW